MALASVAFLLFLGGGAAGAGAGAGGARPGAGGLLDKLSGDAPGGSCPGAPCTGGPGSKASAANVSFNRAHSFAAKQSSKISSKSTAAAAPARSPVPPNKGGVVSGGSITVFFFSILGAIRRTPHTWVRWWRARARVPPAGCCRAFCAGFRAARPLGAACETAEALGGTC
ncbi:unnamed protein product [Pelagomonas calceolata]|uniref:Uncharacterized protein n=1 Tax=Pelagomonas calceolata TaxID=35677 RepID=A0A8J2X2N3_9STRA|nr:unnamed protein product [Pelagomonas calceolata]